MIEAHDFFKCADLQQIIYFILYGKEKENKKSVTYEKRIYSVSTGILEKIRGLNLDRDVYEKVTDDIFGAFKIYEEVYTEIGFKMGARTFFELICEDEKYTLRKK